MGDERQREPLKLPATADAKEGISAFMEKRSAHFPDRVSSDMPSFYPWWQERKFE